MLLVSSMDKLSSSLSKLSQEVSASQLSFHEQVRNKLPTESVTVGVAGVRMKRQQPQQQQTTNAEARQVILHSLH